MENELPVVLAVDDEKFNLEIIKEYLSEENIDTVCVASGEQALAMLKENPQRFSAVLLDRMMPGINGMEVLSKIKANKSINHLPVIMQTAKSGQESMLEGLKAGAHYYLSKPYDQQTLATIVSTAIRDYQRYLNIQQSLEQSSKILKLIIKGEFHFKSLDEARCLAILLAKACPESETVVFVLTELMINAVEHGNLGISYKEKSKLNAENGWENEVLHRLALPEHNNKYATVKVNRNDTEIKFLIGDQGHGFDWQQYMEICPDRAFDSHGRGIALAHSMSLNKIEYLGLGNKVSVTIPLNN